MKKLYLTLLGLMAAVSLSAQNPTTYFMEGTSLRNQWNPAFAPNRGYFNVPLVGSFQVSTEGNLALDNVLFMQDGTLKTLFSSSISSAMVLSDLSSKNYLGAGVQMNLVSFGKYTKNRRNFWAVDVNLRMNVDTQIPYGLFEFMKTGQTTDISDLGFGMETYGEAAFSYSFPITPKLYVGARAKVLVGLARMEMNFDRFDTEMGADRWYAHAVGDLEISGLVPGTKVLSNGRKVYDLEEIDEDFKVPSGYGFAVDLGATYDLLPQLQLSASVNDLGFMSWKKSAGAHGRVERDIEFTGVEIDSEGNAIQPEFDLDELEFDVVESESRGKALRASINVGGEYSFLKRRIGIGVFYNVKFWEYKTRHNLTVSANLRPLKWLHVSGSYQFIDNKASAVGLALNLCPGFINLFVGTDVLLSKKATQWVPIKQSNMNLTFGLGVPIGKRGERHNYTASKKEDAEN